MKRKLTARQALIADLVIGYVSDVPRCTVREVMGYVADSVDAMNNEDREYAQTCARNAGAEEST